MYKMKAEELLAKCEDLQEQLFSFHRQQPLLKMLKSELHNSYETLRVLAVANNMLPSRKKISFFAHYNVLESFPALRYSQRDTKFLKLDRNEIADLSDTSDCLESSHMVKEVRTKLLRQFIKNPEFQDLMKKMGMFNKEAESSQTVEDDPFGDAEPEGTEVQTDSSFRDWDLNLDLYIAQVKSQIADLGDRIKEVEQQGERKAMDVRKELTQKNHQLETSKYALEQENKTLKQSHESTLIGLNADIALLNKRIVEKESLIKEKQEQNLKLTEEMQRNLASNASDDDVKKIFMDKAILADKQISEMQTELEKAKTVLATLETQVSVLKLELANEKKQTADASSKLKEVEQKARDFEQKAIAAEQRVDKKPEIDLASVYVICRALC